MFRVSHLIQTCLDSRSQGILVTQCGKFLLFYKISVVNTGVVCNLYAYILGYEV